MSDRTVYSVSDVAVWLDGGIMIKTKDPHGDPVELGEEEALELIAILQRVVSESKGT